MLENSPKADTNAELLRRVKAFIVYLSDNNAKFIDNPIWQSYYQNQRNPDPKINIFMRTYSEIGESIRNYFPKTPKI